MMKNALRTVSIVAALACSALPGAAWSSRMVGPRLTGSVTSTPGGGRIEIDNHMYHVKSGTYAERGLSDFHLGQVVDVELDPTAPLKSAEVIAITSHVQS
jgi:hypothetical protein